MLQLGTVAHNGFPRRRFLVAGEMIRLYVLDSCNVTPLDANLCGGKGVGEEGREKSRDAADGFAAGASGIVKP